MDLAADGPRSGARPESAAPTSHRLATYGTLVPGEPNHHELADLEGTWSRGVVRGRLSQDGWGAAVGRGYPAITPDPEGERVEVHVFESADLPDQWARLDAFEGEGYVRTPIAVLTPHGEIEAYIYTRNEALAGDA